MNLIEGINASFARNEIITSELVSLSDAQLHREARIFPHTQSRAYSGAPMVIHSRNAFCRLGAIVGSG